jgi:hypothetical protein
MKRYIRRATLEDVQAAQTQPLDRDTADVGIRHKESWHLWEFDREEVGAITVPIDAARQSIPIRDEFPLYQELLKKPEHAKGLASHDYFLARLRAGEPLVPAVLQNASYDRQVHDGGHRARAAFEHMAENPAYRFRVFWNHGRFEADYLELLYEGLSELGVSLERGKGIDHVGVTFWNANRRHLQARPRRVHLAREFEEPKDPEARTGLAALRAKFEAGEDVNPHRSKAANKPSRKPFNDLLLNAWDIHHFHLGEVSSSGSFSGRTDLLLYANVKAEDVYFVDVLPHDNWSRQNLLERVLGNWPHLMKEVGGMRKATPLSDDQVETLRSRGINAPFITGDGTQYFPPGGGFVGAGIALDVRITADHALHNIRRAEAWASANTEMIAESVKRAGFPVPDPMRLRMVLDGNNIVCYEESSKHHMKLLYLFQK